jgi:hypothetical protein
MLEFLWEFEQHRRIAENEGLASRADHNAREARYKTTSHEGRLDTMTLAVMAMWSILQDRLGVTEDQLVKRMQELDLSDGKLDGKVAQPASTCVSCSRVMNARYKRCIYCGGESLDVRPFAGI